MNSSMKKFHSFCNWLIFLWWIGLFQSSFSLFFLIPFQDSRAAADLEKAQKEKEKLQAQIEALKKAAQVGTLQNYWPFAPWHRPLS